MPRQILREKCRRSAKDFFATVILRREHPLISNGRPPAMRRKVLIPLILSVFLGVSIAASAGAAGPPLALDQYRGNVVVLDFWASWCVPCRRSFPWLDAMQRKYADDGLVVIGVNLDSEPEEAAAFLEEFPVGFHIVEDRDAILAVRFELLAMPSAFVIGRDGEIVARHLGFRAAQTEEYEDVLRHALGLAPVAASLAAED